MRQPHSFVFLLLCFSPFPFVALLPRGQSVSQQLGLGSNELFISYSCLVQRILYLSSATAAVRYLNLLRSSICCRWVLFGNKTTFQLIPTAFRREYTTEDIHKTRKDWAREGEGGKGTAQEIVMTGQATKPSHSTTVDYFPCIVIILVLLPCGRRRRRRTCCLWR